jgi:hypothetical protein
MTSGAENPCPKIEHFIPAATSIQTCKLFPNEQRALPTKLYIQAQLIGCISDEESYITRIRFSMTHPASICLYLYDIFTVFSHLILLSSLELVYKYVLIVSSFKINF